jgi:hypothetical protein
MATISEMCDVIDYMNKNNSEWLFGIVMYTPECTKCSIVVDVFIRALLQAEDNGRSYYGVYGAHDEPCTYWMVGDYVVTYPTDDLRFNAGMLTDAMLDDLIIKGSGSKNGDYRGHD